MRLRGKIDGNHSEIVKALRASGHSVLSLANLGGGAPDLLVGRNGVNILLEVKDGSKPPSQRKLTKAELHFLNTWRGQAKIVYDVKSALTAMNLALGL